MAIIVKWMGMHMAIFSMTVFGAIAIVEIAKAIASALLHNALIITDWRATNCPSGEAVN